MIPDSVVDVVVLVRCNVTVLVFLGQTRSKFESNLMFLGFWIPPNDYMRFAESRGGVKNNSFFSTFSNKVFNHTN